MSESSLQVPPPELMSEKRLDSWKEIATYLNRDVTTVQRWEKREGMPVHRHLHDKRGSVYALAAELDSWRKSRKSDSGSEDQESEASVVVGTNEMERASSGTSGRYWYAAAAIAAVLLVAATAYFSFRGRVKETTQPRIRSLAVLPFHNLSGDPSQDYLAEGVTEALIGRLAGIRDLRVTSHTSVERFKNPQQSVPEIAKTLGVDAVVEGSVVREGSRIRVTAQLIRAATDEHFWSETYDRELRDALTLESELAQAITSKVEATVTGQEEQRLTTARPVAPEAYESYLKGRFALEHSNQVTDLKQSIRYFEDAVHSDPKFAQAYLGLAEAWNLLGGVFAGSSPPSDVRPKVVDYAQQALALDPDLLEAHLMLSTVYREEWRWSESESELQHALALSPNDVRVLTSYAIWLACEGRVDEAVATVQQAQARDPATVSTDAVAWILFLAHRYDDAIRLSRGGLALSPDDADQLFSLGFALIADDRPGEAIPVLEKSFSLSKSPAVTGVLIRAYAHAGRRNDALRLLAGLKKRRSEGYIPAGAFLNAYLGLGDTEQAFVWLEQSYKEKSNILLWVKVHPYFDAIRNDPRFMDLIRRMSLN